MSFTSDLAVGRAAEIDALQRIENFYLGMVKAHLNKSAKLSEMRKYDIIDDLGVRWEIKKDRMFARTGNVYLEHKALNHSESNFVIYYLDKPYALIRAELLELINSGMFREVWGGEGNAGSLVPVQIIKAIGLCLEPEFQKTNINNTESQTVDSAVPRRKAKQPRSGNTA